MRGRQGWIPVLALTALTACARAEPPEGAEFTAEDVEQGRRLLRGYDCGGCHTIPGVAASTATVGPPLTDWADRGYIAGALRNTPDNLVAFLMAPQQVQPGGGMPDMGVSAEDARRMAAYLYTLRGAARTLGPPRLLSDERLEELIGR